MTFFFVHLPRALAQNFEISDEKNFFPRYGQNFAQNLTRWTTNPSNFLILDFRTCYVDIYMLLTYSCTKQQNQLHSDTNKIHKREIKRDIKMK